jgi:hypothetical protein|tara:strand:- start:2350 stop:2586 length:237 start_codon:yes stop_codon:yes gene_type:complete
METTQQIMKTNTYRPRWNNQQLDALRRAELRLQWDNPNGIAAIKHAVETCPLTHNFWDLLFLLDERNIKVDTNFPVIR